MESDKIVLFPLNLDAMLMACVPGGSSCDPQKVADNIRAWFDSNSKEWIDMRVVEELRKQLKPGQKLIWRNAFRWCDESGALSNHYEQASVASLAAEFGYTVIVDAGCAAIIRDPRATQCPAPAPCGESVAELNHALGKAFPDDQVSAIKAQSAVLPMVRRMEERLALMNKHAAIDNEVILMLITAGHITPSISTQALNIAHGFEDGPLQPSPKRTEALALRKLVEKGYVTEAMVNHAMNLASGERDRPVKPAAAANPITTGVRPVTINTAETDEFADIREFRRREAEMNRRDAERAAAAHESFLRDMFPYKEVAAVAARDAASAYMESVTQEFDTLPLGPGSIPDAPVTNCDLANGDMQPYKQGGPSSEETVLGFELPAFDALYQARRSTTSQTPAQVARDACPGFESTWKRDDEKTMLRILLLSAESTGFHGNNPAVHLSRIAKWTDAECRAVDEWCVAMHYQASDNDVNVPPKPAVLGSSISLTELVIAVGPREIAEMIAADTRYPAHHFNAVAEAIAFKLPKVDAESLALLDGVLAKLNIDDEHGLENDLRALRKRLTKS